MDSQPIYYSSENTFSSKLKQNNHALNSSIASAESITNFQDSLKTSKVFNDPVHGHIELDGVCMQVIDTPQFQRLRELKQTGAACFVFPGATHTRFEHSIGVCHLANEMIQHLRYKQPELGITDNDIKCVRLAGLCHDLGHGPFSHLFDSGIVAITHPELKWSHEQGSEDMLEYLVKDNSVDITHQELEFIKDLIHGIPRGSYPQAQKTYLFEIVANQRNSIDVDKFDYIQRDTLHIGLKSSLDAGRLIKFARVVDGQICFHQKEAMNLCELFHTRYSLFKRVYTHKVSAAIEYMIQDALVAADPYLNITSAINDMERYVHLNDSILGQIERSTCPELEASRETLLRMRKRDLYRLADQVIVPQALQQRLTKLHISPECIVQCHLELCKSVERSSPYSTLVANDIIVQWLKLNYATKDRHPLESIRFYRKYGNDESISLCKGQVSSFIPEHCQELTIRVYSKIYEKSGYVQRAFRKLLEQVNLELGQDHQLEGIEKEMVCDLDTTNNASAISVFDSGSGIESPIIPICDDSNNVFLQNVTPTRDSKKRSCSVSPKRHSTLFLKTHKEHLDNQSEGMVLDKSALDYNHDSLGKKPVCEESSKPCHKSSHTAGLLSVELIADSALSIPTDFGASTSPFKRSRKPDTRSGNK
ncbi:hypothetical protein BDEG_27148 [Batrachochytrium dendrobatidis JEL423]|uniref:HD/PDEase domain-containing protein n=2 Tax=Batrachochytrium dendrobatidis (strain JEL423) TaxID=403673 RepID=A0A177WWJ4_BATDL|nr:hypothetical protein BDEG_27148 [Batrachochytrium dendrobatidis JEL423]